MTALVHKTPAWVLMILPVGGVAVLLVMLVVGSGAAVSLHRENRVQDQELAEARVGITELVSINTRQDEALERANQRLQRLGGSPVDPVHRQSPFPFSFTFTIGPHTYAITCTNHMPCTVTSTE